MKRNTLLFTCLLVALFASLVTGCTTAPETTTPAPPAKTSSNAAPAPSNPNVPGNAQSQASKLGYNTNNAK